MGLKMKSSLLATIALAFTMHAAADNIVVDDVLGKLIISSAGSLAGGAYLSVGVETKGRNTIELHFVSFDLVWMTPDASAFNQDRKIKDTYSVMIHCRNKRYSTYPVAGDQISWSEYLSGNKYAWGDYSAGDLITNVRQEEKDKMSKLFQNACAYTDV